MYLFVLEGIVFNIIGDKDLTLAEVKRTVWRVTWEGAEMLPRAKGGLWVPGCSFASCTRGGLCCARG